MYSSATVIITYYFGVVICEWGYSSVVEHLTADQEVPSSNLGAPLRFLFMIPLFLILLIEIWYSTSVIK